MQLEPFDDKDGRRCWLSPSEQTTLVDHFGDENPRQRLAVELGLDGLRGDEITWVDEPAEAVGALSRLLADAHPDLNADDPPEVDA